MLYGLLDFDPEDKPSLERFALWHKTDHDEIQKAIQKATGQNLVIWELYPLNMDDWDSWSSRHQQMHNDMNGVAGFAGNDLTDVDWKNKELIDVWQFNHFSEHLNIRTKYGI